MSSRAALLAPKTASSVAPVASGYERSLRPCFGTHRSHPDNERRSAETAPRGNRPKRAPGIAPFRSEPLCGVPSGRNRRPGRSRHEEALRPCRRRDRSSRPGRAPRTAAGSTPKLLTKFQPVLVFHPGEEFRPTTVESFIRDSRPGGGDEPHHLDGREPEPDRGRPADLEPARLAAEPAAVLRRARRSATSRATSLGASDEPGVTVYGRVVKDGKNIVLQYWLFYYDNLYRYPFLPPGAIWQSHEGDWEVVNVVLTNQKRPVEVGLSAHCSGETRPWAETERRDGHPTVYVALGSHANYFEPGLHPFDPACLPAQVIALLPAGRAAAAGRRRRSRPRRRAQAPRRPARRHRDDRRRLAALGRLPGLLGRARVLQRPGADRHRPLRDVARRPRVPRGLARAARHARRVALAGETHGAARTGPPPRGAGACARVLRKLSGCS